MIKPLCFAQKVAPKMPKILVLVIEDERPILENIKDCLEAEGFRVACATCGNDGIELANSVKPDLILCDRAMLNGNGSDVLEAVRANPSIAQTPFIFLTAKISEDETRDGMMQGADDYLKKPFTRKHLLGAIYAQIEKTTSRAADTKSKLAIVSEAIRTHLQHVHGNLELFRHDNPSALENEEFNDAWNATVLAINKVDKLIAAMLPKQSD